MNYPARLNTTPINPAKMSLSYPATPLAKDISNQPKDALNLKGAKINNSEVLPENMTSNVKTEEVNPPKFKMVVVTIKIFEFVPKSGDDLTIPEGIPPVSTMKISFKVSSEEELSALKLELNQAVSGSVDQSIEESKRNIEITRPTQEDIKLENTGKAFSQKDIKFEHEGKAFSIKKLNITLIGKEAVRENKNIAVFPSHRFTLMPAKERNEEGMKVELSHTEMDDLEMDDLEVDNQDQISQLYVNKEDASKKKTESALDFKPTDENKDKPNQDHLEKHQNERIVTSQGASGLSSTCNTPRNFKPLPNFSAPPKK